MSDDAFNAADLMSGLYLTSRQERARLIQSAIDKATANLRAELDKQRVCEECGQTMHHHPCAFEVKSREAATACEGLQADRDRMDWLQTNWHLIRNDKSPQCPFPNTHWLYDIRASIDRARFHNRKDTP